MAGPQPGNVKSVDDLDSINAFLARIGSSQIPPAERRTLTPPPQESQMSSIDMNGPVSEHVSDSDHDTHGLNSNVTSVAASPDTGRRAPPPTPAPLRAAAASSNTTHLEPVPEDDTDVLVALAEESGQDLMDSKHAFSRPTGLLLNKTRAVLAAKSPNATAVKRHSVPDSQRELAEKMKNVNFQDTVLETFRQKNETLTKPTQDTISEDAAKEFLAKVQGNNIGSEDEEDTARSTDAASYHVFKEHIAPSKQLPEKPTNEQSLSNADIPDGKATATPSNTTRSSHKMNLQAAEAVKSKLVEKSREVRQTMVTSVGGTKMPIVVATPQESPAKEEEPEDRENMTHFKTWGAAAPRTTPKARPRKVILTGLPFSADNTLVASLLHGGSIETYELSPSIVASTKRATALFINADAAQRFFDRYPNGIEFKFNGRKCVAFVEMGKDVDVLSSLIRGHMEAGASRVVRATGADEDWGMRALHKLAEGKNRKLEGIADYWRDEVRTIVFRFTNIPDAVHFRGQLIRDYEWEMCNVQFVDDPCASATGVHMDS